MSLDGGWLWLIAAAVLAGLELIVPGVFLVWLALAAGVAGLAALVLGVTAPAQFGIFAVSSVAAVYAGRSVYRRHALPADPLLNENDARLIGRRVTIVDPVVRGEGRARLGDSVWTVTGPDLAAGEQAVILDVRGNVLTVVPAGD